MGTGSEHQRDKSWIERELAGCEFQDERLGKRFRKVLEQLSEGAGETIPMACQDWANTKAESVTASTTYTVGHSSITLAWGNMTGDPCNDDDLERRASPAR